MARSNKQGTRSRTKRNTSTALVVREPVSPNYQRPPVDEVVCGVRFEPLAQFKIPHVGLFWSKFQLAYPKVEHVAPLAAGGSLSVDAASGVPIPRVWFVSDSDDELVQFQIDHLYFNWRRREGAYPRFKTIFPKFKSAKQQLDALLREIGHDPLKIVERELTYINQIPQGEGWNNLEDLPKVLSCLPLGHSEFKFLPAPKNLAWTIRFDLPSNQGALDVKLSQGLRRKDKHPVLMLQLSAKGRSTANDWNATKEWFDLAHRWIVNGFADLTSDAIQQEIWRRDDVAQ